jgi:signal peptidase I
MENTTGNEIENQIEVKKERSSFGTLFLYLFIGLIIAFSVRMIIEPTVVVGDSMESNLHDGEYMLNLKTAYLFSEPEYGDVVIVDGESDNLGVRFLIKRVIGLPEDTIEIKDNKLYRNGQLIKEDYIAEPMKDTTDMKVELKEEEVFVMGDNRNNSLDSRVIGPIDYKEEIRGEVILRLFPFDQSYKDGHFALSNKNN